MKRNGLVPWKDSSRTALFCLIVSVGIIAAGCQRFNPSTTTPVASSPSPAAPQPTEPATGLPSPEPTSLATSLASPQPTEPATGLPSPEPTSLATLAPSSGRVFFFGPIYLKPDPGSFDPVFTGAFIRFIKPEMAISTLEAARAKGVSLFINMAGKRQGYQGPDGAFSVDLFNEKEDAYRNIDLAPYVADGTVIGNLLVDEPQDPTNWNGAPIPYPDIEAIAAHSKQIWPTLPVGAYGPPSYLASGAPWKSLDFGVAQYTVKKGEFASYLGQELDAARQGGLGVVVALNVLSGGSKAQAMSSDQIKDWGQRVVTDPSVCAVIFTRYDPGLMQNPTITPVLGDLGQMARQRAAKSCQAVR